MKIVYECTIEFDVEMYEKEKQTKERLERILKDAGLEVTMIRPIAYQPGGERTVENF